MTPKPTLVNPTNDQISAAVAVHVLGRRVTGDIMRMRDEHLKGTAVTFESWAKIPPFATSADAVLPLLTNWRKADPCHRCCDIRGFNNVTGTWVVELCQTEWKQSADGISENVATAACIALLRAHSVTVTFTNPTREDKV